MYTSIKVLLEKLFAKKLLTQKALLSTSYNCICLHMLINAYALVKTSLICEGKIYVLFLKL